MSGSSPLARGLLAVRGVRCRQRGIIPARAGFTRMETFARPEDLGSSPLARGLLPAGGGDEVPGRIIPARAGFTILHFISFLHSSDHPRSRGVYWPPQYRTRDWQGSSPLARGLLVGRQVIQVGVGIIPARAGFTGLHASTRRQVGDHPRSRGVYPYARYSHVPMLGSSPLARGLQPSEIVLTVPQGIIPARAGFTRLENFNSNVVGDHPRSRGVYALTRFPQHWNEGSSPLARGLPPRRLSRWCKRRIIPARAGFTLGDPWNPNDHSPYQTASAFTADLAPARRRCGSAAVERRSTMTPSEA